MTPPFHIGDPEVSVLTSCYNASRWLQEAIDSVLSQTFQCFEFILVDDGSTDDTWNIIKSYRARDQRIVAISKDKTGLADSLNLGIARARGRWIARLDADDLCEPMRLQEQVNFVHHHPEVVLLGTGFVEINEHGKAVKKHLYPSEHPKLVRHLLRLQRFFPHSSAFYRVDAVRHVGGYNPRIRRAEDHKLWLDLTLQGRIACLPDPLVRHRKHSGQISLENNGRRQLCDGIAAIVCYFLRRAGHNDPSTIERSEEWYRFLSWIEERIEKAGLFDQRKAWVDARMTFFATRNRFIGALRSGAQLVQSRNVRNLVLEKCFGSSLPHRLAREWMRTSCADS